MRKDVEILQCHYCDFMTNDEVVFMSHVGDAHSPKVNCGACGETLTDTKKRLEHVMISNAFNYGEKQTWRNMSALIVVKRLTLSKI